MNPCDVSQLYVDAFDEFLASRGLTFAAAPGDAASQPCASGFVQRRDGAAFAAGLAQAVAQSGDADLGLRFGAAIGGRGFGLLGIATAAAPSLADSLASLARWEPLTSTLGQISVRRSRRQLRLVWTPQPGMPAALVEGVLAGWVTFGRFLAGAPLPVDAVELAQPRRRGSEAEALLGCPVRWNAAWNAVVIPADVLAARPRYADATLHAALAGWLDDCVAVLRRGDGATLAAGRGILAGLAWGEAGEDEVARQLGLARRTLQRRMADSGTSFRRLRDLLRASIAVCRLSDGGERLLEVAQRVGYAEQASFSRAVRLWAGRTPREISRLFAADYAALRAGGAAERQS